MQFSIRNCQRECSTALVLPLRPVEDREAIDDLLFVGALIEQWAVFAVHEGHIRTLRGANDESSRGGICVFQFNGMHPGHDQNHVVVIVLVILVRGAHGVPDRRIHVGDDELLGGGHGWLEHKEQQSEVLHHGQPPQ